MEGFFGFCSSTQPQKSGSSSTSISLPALFPNTAENSYHVGSTQTRSFWCNSGLLLWGYFLFSHVIKLSIVDVDAPVFPIPVALLLELRLPFVASHLAIFMNCFLISLQLEVVVIFSELW